MSIFKLIMNKKRLFKLIIIYACIVFLFYAYFLGNRKSKIKQRQIERYRNSIYGTSSELEDDHSNTVEIIANCSIIDENKRQFSVNIDGITYPKYVPLFFNDSLNFDCMNKNKRKNLILFWNKWFGDGTYEYGLGKRKPFVKNFCPVTNCELTSDRSRVRESDFVVFHMRDDIYSLPLPRRPNQYWIFLLFESPMHSYDYSAFNGLFNLTSTYKLNSDFTSFYFAVSPFKWGNNMNFDVNNDFHADKTGFAAAIISNCEDYSKRLRYIEKLQRYVSVDVYGKCGLPCPTSFDNGTEATEADCKQLIAEKYKFYLSFENSICKDYITEKFFEILRYNIIPVVLSGGEYDSYVPKSGYINTFDYNSPKELADYLNYLASNKTAYNSYFKWKKHVYFDNNFPRLGHICEFCIKLNLFKTFNIQKEAIQDLSSLWSVKKDCYQTGFMSIKRFYRIPYLF